MIRRFSREELYALRNKLPIEWVIEKLLVIPSKLSDGVFRFQCPLCQEFNTATKHETNLARCFACRRNFNTLEIVMQCKGIGFVQSATLLTRCINDNSSGNRGDRVHKRITEELPTRPLSTGEILRHIASAIGSSR